jgi:hypothetical protein
LCSLFDNGPGNVGDGNRRRFDGLHRDAVSQSMGMPLQSKVTGQEFLVRYSLMRFTARFRRPCDHTPREMEPHIIGQSPLRRIEQRVLPGPTRSHDKYQHRCPALTRPNVALACTPRNGDS